MTTYKVVAEHTYHTEFTFDDEDIGPGDTPEDAAGELLPDINSINWELVDWDINVKEVKEK
jgi:hypothetical protein